jgi:hypothetical protein
MKALTCVMFSLFLCAAVMPASAQDHQPEQRLRCDDSDGGIVRGFVLNDSTHQPIARRGVSLRPAGDGVAGWCGAVTDSLGRFKIGNVPPGEYYIAPGTLGFRQFEPVRLEVTAGSVADLELRLWPGNLVADCQDVPACADLLEPRPDFVTHLIDEERIEEAIWRTTIALAGKAWDSNWVPCADVENERVREALLRRIPGLVPTLECERLEGFIRQIRHIETGDPARIVRVSRIDAMPEGIEVRSGFFAGSLHAEGWRCLYTEEYDGWTAQWCHVTSVS